MRESWVGLTAEEEDEAFDACQSFSLPGGPERDINDLYYLDAYHLGQALCGFAFDAGQQLAEEYGNGYSQGCADCW
jgi:hypothetical protein